MEMANVTKFLGGLRKSLGSESFATSRAARINDWIDTGNYALNRIVSGSVYNGIPAGRVVLLSGDSTTGKTLLAGLVLNSALKMNYDHIFYFDSEGGIMKTFFEKLNCPPDKIEHILVDSVEDATVKVSTVYSGISEFKAAEPDAKFLCVLDSLGSLVPMKLIKDALEKGKQVQDQGLRAKLVNTFMKSAMIPALKTETTFLVINHTYDDPAAMYPSKIKNTSGGKGKDFASHVSIQCSKKFESVKKPVKPEDVVEGAEPVSKLDVQAYSGNTLTFFTTKNRIVKPFYEAEIYVDFSKGFNKYDGLLEAAMKYGFIVQCGAYYMVPSYSDKKMRKVDFINNPEVWDTFIKDFDRKSMDDMAYSNLARCQDDDEIDDLNEISGDQTKSTMLA
jgi:RecA/RadA recombinase